MFSVKNIQEIQLERENKKKEMYKVILSHACKKIQIDVSRGNSHTIFQIPSIIMGFPIIHNESEYIARQLNHLGYTTSILGPMTIHIRWPMKVKKKEKKLDIEEDQGLSSLVNLKKTADNIRRKYGV
jgi:hypothetical protein